MRAIHIGIGFWLLFALLRWGDWNNIKRFYPTMLYIIICKLLYEFIAHEKFYLWKLQPDFILNFFGVVMLHACFLYPFSGFLFLSNYPKEFDKQILHFLKWILIYALLEWIGFKYGTIAYYNGWSFWWSLLFDVHMLLFIRLHYVKPLWAIPLSPLSTLFYMLMFNML
ncbi:CBO0543 family protein [Ectobacillus funiculus]|uniref:CBO0543 family protein n=1 Tax=Bacillaceae TaxID=186817 RepID=UPI003CCC5F74